jgi:hypothetical protein
MELRLKPTARRLRGSGQIDFVGGLASRAKQIAWAKLCMFTIEFHKSLISLMKIGVSRPNRRFQPSLFRLSGVTEMQ